MSGNIHRTAAPHPLSLALREGPAVFRLLRHALYSARKEKKDDGILQRFRAALEQESSSLERLGSTLLAVVSETGTRKEKRMWCAIRHGCRGSECIAWHVRQPTTRSGLTRGRCGLHSFRPLFHGWQCRR